MSEGISGEVSEEAGSQLKPRTRVNWEVGECPLLCTKCSVEFTANGKRARITDGGSADQRKKFGSQMRRPATRTLLVTPALTRQKSQMDVQVK
ncbi:MAG TPA: hypothetical protein VHV10_18920 [Ktedonobacteraceae bacterium]|jgi:hypothetical protein|nr:hypothetical protein [Ktedonobacteraceae bacterium]